MNTDTIANLRRLLAEATPGPWSVETTTTANGHYACGSGPWILASTNDPRVVADARLIAALVTAAPELLAAAELVGLAARPLRSVQEQIDSLTRERDEALVTLDRWREQDAAQRECHAVYVESSQAEIARLTCERDSYLASMELAVSRLVGVAAAVGGEWGDPEGLPEAVAKLRTERDRAIADHAVTAASCTDTTLRLMQALRERDEARAALRSIEWGMHGCPECLRRRDEGHAKTCTVVRALGGGYE